MRFRIRDIDGGKSKYEQAEIAYREHLRQFRKSSNSDLWKYFYWDFFFNEGDVESVELQSDLRTVKMRLNCPNIKRYDEQGRYEFLNAKFECTFSGVGSFSIRSDEPEFKWGSEGCYSAMFIDSEINTSPLLATIKSGLEEEPDQYYSLLIRFLVDDFRVWLEIVFFQVNVVSDEPLTFALMESDPKFEVPVYSEKKDEHANGK